METWQCHFRLKNFQWSPFPRAKITFRASSTTISYPPLFPPKFHVYTRVYTHTTFSLSRCRLQAPSGFRPIAVILTLTCSHLFMHSSLYGTMFCLHGPDPLGTSQNERYSHSLTAQMGNKDGALLLGVIYMGRGWGEATINCNLFSLIKNVLPLTSSVNLDLSLPLWGLPSVPQA